MQAEQLELVEVAAPLVTEVAQTSESEAAAEAAASEQTGVTDTPETTVAETDEQKNARVQQDAQRKSEKRANGVQRRMDEPTREKYAERTARENSDRLNVTLLDILKGNTASATPSSDGRPTQDQFTDYAEFVRADATWHATQAATSLLEKTFKTQQETQQRQSNAQVEQTIINAYVERHKEAAKSIPDFAEVMEDADTINVPTPVLNMIRRMENGPVVAYHMVKNPALAQKFFNTPPEMHGILLGQLSATLKGSAKVSNAPAPGKPSQTKSGGSSEPPEDTEAYMAWAAKHMK